MIQSIRIRNFKSLGDVTISLDPVTVLIGPTGTGKSNCVQALRFLRDYLLFRNEAVVIQQINGGWQQLVCATADRPYTLYFGLRFRAPGFGEGFEYQLCFREQQSAGVMPNPVFYEEKLSLSDHVIFHQQGGKWLTAPKLAYPPGAGQLALGGLTGIPESTVAYLVLSRGVGCYSFPDGVLLQPATAAPMTGFGGQPPASQDRGLTDHGENYAQALVGIISDLQTWDRWKQILAALQRLDPSLQSIDYEMPQGSRIVVSHDVGGSVLGLDLKQESEGFRRFLTHLIALYQVPSKQTLIFEEPEKGIHPGALAVLADQFKACPAAGRGQVILTTHSPELLDCFEPESFRVVKMENYLTRIGPVATGQIESIREQLMRPGELLTVVTPQLAEAAATDF